MCRLIIVALAWLVFSTWSSSHAQTYPNRPIRIVVPFPPGGATDANARALAKEVESLLGQPLVIDNRGGANGIIGCDLVEGRA
jgi:tripartite-type tricarboxylate transporter receptor subunit TctC